MLTAGSASRYGGRGSTVLFRGGKLRKAIRQGGAAAEEGKTQEEEQDVEKRLEEVQESVVKVETVSRARFY